MKVVVVSGMVVLEKLVSFFFSSHFFFLVFYYYSFVQTVRKMVSADSPGDITFESKTTTIEIYYVAHMVHSASGEHYSRTCIYIHIVHGNLLIFRFSFGRMRYPARQWSIEEKFVCERCAASVFVVGKLVLHLLSWNNREDLIDVPVERRLPTFHPEQAVLCLTAINSDGR